MSWMLFMDESGHDHRSLPYEVRRGVALHANRLWNFVQGWKELEENCFGAPLALYKIEVKGSKLLKKSHYLWAQQMEPLSTVDRKRLCRKFLTKGLEKKPPTREEFTAYGQACLAMANGVMTLLKHCEAQLFASAIPRGIKPPADFQLQEYLRKDHVFLFERFYYFLQEEGEHGIIVMDETEKSNDRKFVAQLQRYFSATVIGQERASRIVPSPFFVSSDMEEAVQAADLCIYSINWGYRLPSRGMSADTRQEIAADFGPSLSKLQYRGSGSRGGAHYSTYGIVYVSDPYDGR